MFLKLAYSNLWISLSAAGHVLLTQFCLGLELRAWPAFLAFSTMYMVYTLAKAVHFDPQADAVNDPERTRFLCRWRFWLIGLATVLYAGSLVWLWPRGLVWLALFPFVTAVLYDFRLLPSGWRYRRLKDIPGVKSLVVGLTWGVVVTLFPVLLAEGPSSKGWVVAGWALWNSLLWFVNTVYFDIGDMEGDRLEGTQTLPLVLGLGSTLRLLWLTTLIAWCLLGGLLASGQLPAQAVWAHGLELYALVYLTAARSPGKDLGFWCDVVADGQGVLAALLVLAGSVS